MWRTTLPLLPHLQTQKYPIPSQIDFHKIPYLTNTCELPSEGKTKKQKKKPHTHTNLAICVAKKHHSTAAPTSSTNPESPRKPQLGFQPRKTPVHGHSMDGQSAGAERIWGDWNAGADDCCGGWRASDCGRDDCRRGGDRSERHVEETGPRYGKDPPPHRHSHGVELGFGAFLECPVHTGPLLVGLPFLRHHHNGERPGLVAATSTITPWHGRPLAIGLLAVRLHFAIRSLDGV